MDKVKKLLDKIPSGIKTLAWNVFYQGIAFMATGFAEGLSSLEINDFYKVGLGLILAQISKWAAKKINK